jgi:hypothetical protein
MAKKKTGKLKKRYKAVKMKLRQILNQANPKTDTNNTELQISERAIWPILIYLLEKNSGKLRIDNAHSELLRIIPYTQEYRDRKYDSGTHKGKSVIEHHLGFLRGQANEKTKDWHDVMKPANQTQDDYYELTDFGKAFASGIRPLSVSFLDALKQSGIKVYVK